MGGQGKWRKKAVLQDTLRSIENQGTIPAQGQGRAARTMTPHSCSCSSLYPSPQEKRNSRRQLWERGVASWRGKLPHLHVPSHRTHLLGLWQVWGQQGGGWEGLHSRAHVVPFRMPGAHGGPETAPSHWARNSATGSRKAVLGHCPKCQRLVAAGTGRGPPPAPGDLAVPDATARKCVRCLRKSLLCFHKIIITAACHGP